MKTDLSTIDWRKFSLIDKECLQSLVNTLSHSESTTKYWMNLDCSDTRISLAFDQNNNCQGAFYLSQGNGFNLFIGAPNISWSEPLTNLLKDKVSFVSQQELWQGLDDRFLAVQLGFLGTTKVTSIASLLISQELSLQTFQTQHTEDLILFLKQNYPRRYLDLYYKNDDFSPLDSFVNSEQKWAYLAFLNQKIVGYVSYFKATVPLLGQTCAFVADLVVLKELRGNNIAPSIQSHAYKHIQKDGIDWVLGSIFPDNKASIKQALKLKRENQINLVEFSP